MKTLIFLLVIQIPFLLQGEILYPKIAFTENDSNIVIYHSEVAQVNFPNVQIDSVKYIWHYTFNPFNFKAGERIDTTDSPELTLDKDIYSMIYCTTVFYSNQFQTLGRLYISSNNLFLPNNNLPSVNFNYQNPVSDCTNFNVETNGYWYKIQLVKFSVLKQESGNVVDNRISYQICSNFPGEYYIKVTIKFNHPYLKKYEWLLPLIRT